MPKSSVLSTRAVASLVARIFGPSIYDAPPFNGGNPLRLSVIEQFRPFPEPWREVMLNPQPMPPGERYALTLADSHILNLLSFDRLATLLGGDQSGRALERGLKFVTEIDELCPRWPRWPGWPWPQLPGGIREEMTPTELFVFGTRLLAGSEQFEQRKLQDALAGLGDKILEMSTKGMN